MLNKMIPLSLETSMLGLISYNFYIIGITWCDPINAN